MSGRKGTLALLVLSIVLISGCEVYKPLPIVTVKEIDAFLEVNPPLPNFVYCEKVTLHDGGVPITGATVVAGDDTLDEVTPGEYAGGCVELCILPDTFRFVIIHNDHTVSYSLPVPQNANVTIVEPTQGETFDQGARLNVVWRAVEGVSYYEVMLVPSDSLIGCPYGAIEDTLVSDTSVSVTLPDISGQLSVVVKAVYGPEFDMGRPVPNYMEGDWQGIFAIKEAASVSITVR